MFFLICLAAFGALYCIFYTGRLEMEARARDYRRKIHKRLLVRAPGAEKDLTCDLWSATYIIGRMKSKCDLCLSGDPYVSRIHAAMLYDGHTYRIKPICHTRAGRSYTSDVYVNDIRVPLEGTLLEDGDEIMLGRTAVRYVNVKGKTR
ncbi:MAG: FHA domain-containing protein [Lachnospiraceae bacterium]|nr:FHA domain-containing protein [Lachnospiraceae bacterium]MBQ4304224.1 FHA domain-containing protein [Lachnospiraceae bacterium]